MATDKEIAAALARLGAVASNPEIARCIGLVRALADYDIPQERAGCFQRFHAFITTPPKYITAWRSNKADEKKWYHRHVNGVLGDVRGAMAATHYHKARLDELERSVAAALSASNFSALLANANAVSTTGSTRKMDFEYQALVLAIRRCLDYLAGALACYFKRESNSFRKLPKFIRETKRPRVAEAISQAHKRHVATLAFVLEEGRKSVRNRIAHYEFVSAGQVNLTPRGFILAGGGEELSSFRPAGEVTLQEALANRLDCLHGCVDDMIDSFIAAAREFESS